MAVQLLAGSKTSTYPKSYCGSALKWCLKPSVTGVPTGMPVVGN
jgi:hypothetical protein